MIGKGNGSFIAGQSEYFEWTCLVIPTLCMHNAEEIVDFVEDNAPELHLQALANSKSLPDYVNAIAVLSPGMFQRALTVTSPGCDVTPWLDSSATAR